MIDADGHSEIIDIHTKRTYLSQCRKFEGNLAEAAAEAASMQFTALLSVLHFCHSFGRLSLNCLLNVKTPRARPRLGYGYVSFNAAYVVIGLI